MTTPSTPQPFAAARTVVRPEWIDHNGHMNVGYYHVAFDQAADDFFLWFGLTPEIRQAHGSSTFALESHLHFHREVRLGDPLRFESRLIDVDAKRIHFYSEMYHATEGFLAATYESLSIHMDMRTRKTAPMPEPLAKRLAEVLAEHRQLPRPWQLGHVISTKAPSTAKAGGQAG